MRLFILEPIWRSFGAFNQGKRKVWNNRLRLFWISRLRKAAIKTKLSRPKTKMKMVSVKVSVSFLFKIHEKIFKKTWKIPKLCNQTSIRTHEGVKSNKVMKIALFLCQTSTERAIPFHSEIDENQIYWLYDYDDIWSIKKCNHEIYWLGFCVKFQQNWKVIIILQGQWSWVRRIRICAPNIWAISKEDIDFAQPIFGPYFMYCAPNLKLLPPPLFYA